MCTGMEMAALGAVAGGVMNPDKPLEGMALGGLGGWAAPGIGNMLSGAGAAAAGSAAGTAATTLGTEAATAALAPELAGAIAPEALLAEGVMSGSAGSGVGQALASGAGNTLFGLTGTQLAQQAALQGGATLIQTLGAQQKQKEQEKVDEDYLYQMDQLDNQAQAQFAESMAGFTPEAAAAGKEKFMADQLGMYDANMLNMIDPSSGLLAGTPQEVIDTYRSKAAAEATRGRNQFTQMSEMRSLGNFLTGAENKFKQGQVGLGNLGSIGQASTSGYGQGSAAVAGGGNALGGVGSMVGSLGNLMLANQLSKGKKPAGVFDYS
jgi:hypothetical protein